MIIPQIRTLAVDHITPEGARFNAVIVSGDAETITEHGFVWGRVDFLTVNNSDKISIEDAPATDQFSCEVSSSLEEMKGYFVRSYIKAGNLVVYGDPVQFTSLGSLGPEITDFEPKTATWGDTVSIYGKNFGSQQYQNIVHFGKLQGIMISVTNELIKVRVPDITSQFCELSVEIMGNRVVAGTLFELITPGKITGTNKNVITWGDTLELEGIFPQADHQLGIYVENTAVSILNITASRITIVIPNALTYTDSVLIGLSIDLTRIDYIHKLHLKKPVLTSILPLKFGWGDTIELTGIFNPLIINNLVYFSGIQATILESSGSKIKCTIPNINGHVASLSFKISNYAFNHNTDISLSGPIITSVTPDKISSNNFILIRGKYFKEGNTNLKINNTLCESTVYPDRITATVPNTYNGMATVEIDVYNKSVINADLLEVVNPEITGIIPRTGVVGDIVTITGIGFDPFNTTVTAEGLILRILEISPTAIKIEIPYNIQDYSYFHVNSYGTTCRSQSTFHLLPPQVLSIFPLIARPGDIITMTGQNFNPVENNINVGNFSAQIISQTASSITFIMPNQTRGDYLVNMSTYAHQTTSVDKITCQSPWSVVRTLPKTPNSGMGVILDGEIFIFGGYNSQKSYISFDITGGSASEGIDCPENSKIDGVSYAVSGTGYMGLGRLHAGEYTNFFYKFDPSDRTWSSANNFSGTPRGRSFFFSIGDKCYLGGGSRYETQFDDFWVYDALTREWYLLGTFPGGKTSKAYAQVANNKAYVINGTELWEYTPENNSWLKKADFPSVSRIKGCGFVIDNVVYFGTGFNETGTRNDFWKYEPELDKWTRLTNYPFNTYGGFGGSYNGTGYIMTYGTYNEYNYWDEGQLLQYDPANE